MSVYSSLANCVVLIKCFLNEDWLIELQCRYVVVTICRKHCLISLISQMCRAQFGQVSAICALKSLACTVSAQSSYLQIILQSCLSRSHLGSLIIVQHGKTTYTYLQIARVWQSIVINTLPSFGFVHGSVSSLFPEWNSLTSLHALHYTLFADCHLKPTGKKEGRLCQELITQKHDALKSYRYMHSFSFSGLGTAKLKLQPTPVLSFITEGSVISSILMSVWFRGAKKNNYANVFHLPILWFVAELETCLLCN